MSFCWCIWLTREPECNGAALRTLSINQLPHLCSIFHLADTLNMSTCGYFGYWSEIPLLGRFLLAEVEWRSNWSIFGSETKIWNTSFFFQIIGNMCFQNYCYHCLQLYIYIYYGVCGFLCLAEMWSLVLNANILYIIIINRY